MFCTYKDIFGRPNEGVHSYRFLGLAIIDIILTCLLVLFISCWFNFNIFYTFCIIFTIAELFHIIFCVDTYVIKLFKSFIKI